MNPGVDPVAWTGGPGTVFMLGVVFIVLGGVDVALAWYPFVFGDPEWEFGTVTATFNNLPVVLLGAGCITLATGIGRTRRVGRALWGGLFLLAAVFLLGALALYVTTLPVALRAVEGTSLVGGLHKSVIKTLVQGLCYPVAFGWLAVRLVRAGERRVG